MSSNPAMTAESLTLRGITLLSVCKRDSDERYTDFFGEAVEHFVPELFEGTDIKKKVCYIIFKTEDEAKKYVSLGNVKIYTRTHRVKQLLLEDAERILPRLQPPPKDALASNILQVLTDNFKRRVTLDLDNSRAPYRCEFCNINVETADRIFQHLDGRRHKISVGKVAAEAAKNPHP